MNTLPASTNPNPTAQPLQRQGRRAPGFRLSPTMRKTTLVIHIVSGVGWMGVDIVLATLLLTGLTTDSGVTAASAYNAVGIFAPPALSTLSLLMLASGLILGWGTKWGLLRYWWVAAKLAIGLVMTALVWFTLAPELSGMEAQDAAMSADAIRDQLGSATTQLLFPPFVSFALLGVSVVLSMFKPWGKTTRSRPGTPNQD